MPCAADWHRVDSPNFVVIGDLSGGDLRTVAKKFEGFRETLSRVLSDNVTATAVPTVVIVFPSDRSFTPFKPRYEGKVVPLSGIFVGRQDINYIGIVFGGDESLRIVFHEYAHLVIANATRNMPLWLNEGFADYFSTYEESAGGQEALIGRAVSNHLLRLAEAKLLPINELRQVDHGSPHYNERERQSVFYAESWALTHMLRIGLPDRTRQLTKYLNSVERGVSEPDAWNQAFGAENIEKALRAYIAQPTFRATRYTFKSKLASFDAPVQNLSDGDAEALLSDFLIRMQRPAEAAERLEKAAKAGVAGAALTTVAATLDLANGKEDSAEKGLLGLGQVSDWLTAYLAGIGVADLAERQILVNPTERLASARRLFAVVQTTRGDVPNASAREARLTLRQRVTPSPELRALIERARRLAPGRDDYALLHAELLAQSGAYAEARGVLGPLLTNAYPEYVRNSAQSLMGYVGSLETSARRRIADPRTDGNAAGAGARESRAAAAAPPSSPPPPSEFVPAFGPVAAGERRIEGRLERIECAAKRVTFHVRTATGPAEASVPSLSDVDFITFRDDVSGTVTCGALPKPMAVYITVKEGSPAGQAATVVAIEFLPK